MPPNELFCTIAQSVLTGAHWPGGQKILEVLGQFLGGRVAAERVLVHRLPDDVVEIPAQLTVAAGLTRSREFLLADYLPNFFRCSGLKTMRAFTGQELIEHGAERIHVCGRGDGFPKCLLGARIVRRHDWHNHRDAGSRGEIRRTEDLCDSKIEQFGNAVFGDEDIRRLQIAVHNQILVCVVDSATHGTEQLQALTHRKPAPVAIGVDRLAVYILHRKVRALIGRTAAVEQHCNVRVRKSGANAALSCLVPLSWNLTWTSSPSTASTVPLPNNLCLTPRGHPEWGYW